VKTTGGLAAYCQGPFLRLLNAPQALQRVKQGVSVELREHPPATLAGLPHHQVLGMLVNSHRAAAMGAMGQWRQPKAALLARVARFLSSGNRPHSQSPPLAGFPLPTAEQEQAQH